MALTTVLIRLWAPKNLVKGVFSWNLKGYSFWLGIRKEKEAVFTVEEILTLQNYISHQPDEVRDYWMPILAKM